MKKCILMLLTLVLTLSLFAGCASGDSALYNNRADKTMEVMEAGSANGEGIFSNVASTDLSVASNRKLIRTIDLTAETEHYDALIADIEQQVEAIGGYLESIDAYTPYSSTRRYATMTIRVPAEQLDSFVATMGSISNIVRRSERTDDITLSYVDTQSERDALKIEQERLLSLLESAESLSDILEIESRLTEVRYRLESIESQLRTYDNLVDYATVNLSVEEVAVLTPTEEKGFWQKIGDGFVNSLRNVWSGAKTLFSSAIIALPYLLVLALLAGIVLLIVWVCTRKQRKARREQQS